MPSSVEIAADILTVWANSLTSEMIAKLDEPNDKGFPLPYRSLLRQEISGGGTVQQLGDTAVQFQLMLPDYYVYIDLGVKGIEHTYPSSSRSPYQYKKKYPNTAMAQSIEKWITTAGIRVRKNKGEAKAKVFDRRKRLSYAIATNIKKKGIAARRFFTDVVTDDKIDQLNKSLAAALGNNFTLSVASGFPAARQ